jgi:hypothetical protein
VFGHDLAHTVHNGARKSEVALPIDAAHRTESGDRIDEVANLLNPCLVFLAASGVAIEGDVGVFRFGVGKQRLNAAPKVFCASVRKNSDGSTARIADPACLVAT